MENKELYSSKTESAGHKLGKKLVRNILRSKRFTESEIKEEYPIIFPTGRVRYIDIVAISDKVGKKVAYEVGDLNGGSLEELYCIFDNVNRLSKINIEEKSINEILNFFNKEIDILEDNIKDKTGYLDESDREQFRLKLIIKNRRLYSYNSLFEGKWVLSEEKLNEYIKEEIDFVYNKVSLEVEQTNKIQRHLFNYYKNYLDKLMKQVEDKVEEVFSLK